jgi:hypothetical protein
MNMTISPQIKILALVGVLAAVGLAASMFVLGGSSAKTDTAAASTPVAQPRTPVKTHKTVPPVTKPRVVVHKHAPAKHAAKPRHHAKAVKPTAFRGNPVYAQLPQPLQWQLAHHKVVVVSFYNPSSNVDAISVAEAHAGATAAGAGFLLVSVLDNKVAGILTGLLPDGGLLPDPGVFIYRAPGDVAIRLDGFADRDTVAQAATNVMSGETGPVSTSTTPVTAATAPAAAAPATTGAP